ncbi:MAG: hypothetical protein ABFS08_13230 [Pseudomonadota bacterium]
MAILPTPPWLTDEAQLMALLHAVLDRFDLQAGEARQQRLYFNAEKYLPSLKRVDEEADQLWRFVRLMEKEQLLAIRPGKRGEYDAEWKGASLAFAPKSEETLRHWLTRPREEPALRGWREAVHRHADAFPNGIAPLIKRRITLPGWEDERVVTTFARLGKIDTPHTLRQLAALYFNGDSKRLDEREDLIRALFPSLPLKPRSLVIAVHLPVQCCGVLFIENQDNYASTVIGDDAAARGLALVYAAGFRGGAERIRVRQAALLHYQDSHESHTEHQHFEEWWFDQDASPPGPLYFFGDLDYSGMAILAALRKRFGDVTAWQPGYAPLLERLRDGLGHTPNAADKQQQIDPGTTGCPYADNILLPATRQFGFIDQEAITELG